MKTKEYMVGLKLNYVTIGIRVDTDNPSESNLKLLAIENLSKQLQRTEIHSYIDEENVRHWPPFD